MKCGGLSTVTNLEYCCAILTSTSETLPPDRPVGAPGVTPRRWVGTGAVATVHRLLVDSGCGEKTSQAVRAAIREG